MTLFDLDADARLCGLHRALQSGAYRPGVYRVQVVRDPKTRVVAAPAMADRVVPRGGAAVSAATPLATVVIPARNAAAEIERCVKAALAQDLPRGSFRVVVVDNGSGDDTADGAVRAGAEVLREARLSSSYAARNRGIEAATGAWVAFTDSDCVPEPSWLRLLLADPIPDEVGAIVGEVL